MLVCNFTTYCYCSSHESYTEFKKCHRCIYTCGHVVKVFHLNISFCLSQRSHIRRQHLKFISLFLQSSYSFIAQGCYFSTGLRFNFLCWLMMMSDKGYNVDGKFSSAPKMSLTFVHVIKLWNNLRMHKRYRKQKCQ